MRMRKIKVRGLVSKLPASIDLNVEKLVIGKSIAAGDINIDGLTILHPKNISVISVQTQRAVVVEEEVAKVTTATPAAATAAATPAKTEAKK